MESEGAAMKMWKTVLTALVFALAGTATGAQEAEEDDCPALVKGIYDVAVDMAELTQKELDARYHPAFPPLISPDDDDIFRTYISSIPGHGEILLFYVTISGTGRAGSIIVQLTRPDSRLLNISSAVKDFYNAVYGEPTMSDTDDWHWLAPDARWAILGVNYFPGFISFYTRYDPGTLNRFLEYRRR